MTFVMSKFIQALHAGRPLSMPLRSCRDAAMTIHNNDIRDAEVWKVLDIHIPGQRVKYIYLPIYVNASNALVPKQFRSITFLSHSLVTLDMLCFVSLFGGFRPIYWNSKVTAALYRLLHSLQNTSRNSIWDLCKDSKSARVPLHEFKGFLIISSHSSPRCTSPAIRD